MDDVFNQLGRMVIVLLTDKGILDHKILRNQIIREMNETLKSDKVNYEERIRILKEQVYSNPQGEKYCLGEKAIEKIIKIGDKPKRIIKSNPYKSAHVEKEK